MRQSRKVQPPRILCYSVGMENNDTEREQEIPTQQSASDTSNWDDRVSLDPNGEAYKKDF